MDTNLGKVVLIKDINPGFSKSYDYNSVYQYTYWIYPESSSPYNLVEFKDKLYFTADDGETGNELFVSDGTAEGTQLLVDLRLEANSNGFSLGGLVEFKDKLYFTANDGETGNELFVSDGTAEGTQLLVDLRPGADSYGFINSSSPYNLVEFKDKLYFTANDGETGNELFVSDGTAEGTQLLVDLRPGENDYGYSYGPIPKSSSPNNLVEFNGKLYFTANDGENGNEIFVSDGTAEGTQLLVDLYPGEDNYGYINNSSPSGAKLKQGNH